MKTKTAFLHAGMHKTGTTSIQTFMKGNASVLDELGVAVPGFRGLIQSFHRSLSTELGGSPKFDRANGSFEDLERVLEGCDKDVVISCEMFSVYIARKECLERLITFFEKFGYRLHIIGYIRNQPEYLNSRYSQEVKRLLRQHSFEEYLSKQVGHPLHDFQNLFGPALEDPRVDVTMKHFESAVPGGLEWSFLDILFPGGYDRSRFTIEGRRNETPHPMVVYLSRLVTVAIMEMAERWPGDRRLYGRKINKIAEAQGWGDTKFNGLTDENAARIREAYQASNEAFAQRVWGRSWPDAPVRAYVSNEFNPEHATAEELQKFEKLTAKVMEWGRKNRPTD